MVPGYFWVASKMVPGYFLNGHLEQPRLVPGYLKPMIWSIPESGARLLEGGRTHATN